MSTEVHPVDEILPIPRLLALGLRHVLVMYAGAVAAPLIIGRALKLPPEDGAYLISADLFACGLATLVQCVGFPGVGIRLLLCAVVAVLLNAFFNGIRGSATAEADAVTAASSAQHG
jgi:xanthine/uracil permease